MKPIFLLTALGSLVFISLDSGIAGDPPTPYVMELDASGHLQFNREWTFMKEAKTGPRTVYATQSASSKKVATIKPGEKFVALSGELRVRPRKIKVLNEHKLGNVTFKQGQEIYLLGYTGEGAMRVWHDGKTSEVEIPEILDRANSLSAMGEPCKTPSEKCWLELSDKYQAEEWVKIRTPKGVIGWIQGTAYLDSGEE